MVKGTGYPSDGQSLALQYPQKCGTHLKTAHTTHETHKLWVDKTAKEPISWLQLQILPNTKDSKPSPRPIH